MDAGERGELERRDFDDDLGWERKFGLGFPQDGLDGVGGGHDDEAGRGGAEAAAAAPRRQQQDLGNFAKRSEKVAEIGNRVSRSRSQTVKFPDNENVLRRNSGNFR